MYASIRGFSHGFNSQNERALANLMYGVLSLIAVALFFYCFSGYQAGSFSVFVPACALLPVLLLFACFAALAVKYRDSAADTFLLVACPAVFAFAFFMLPGSVPDETVHLAQTVNLFARGTDGFQIPTVLSLNWSDYPQTYADAFRALDSFGSWSDTYLCPRPLLSYLPHLYLPSAFVMGVGDLFNLNIYACLLVSRVANGLIYLLVGYKLVKLVPLGKTFLVVYLLNPIAVQQAASMSADSTVNTIVLSFVVYFLYVYLLDTVGKRQYLVLAGLTALMCVSKFIYAPLVFLLVLLLKKRVSPSSFKKLFIGLCVILVVGSVCTIVFYHGSFMPESFDLLRNPAECIKVMLKSFWVMGTFWFESFAGRILGSLNINVWGISFYLYLATLFVVLFYNDDEWKGLDTFAVVVFFFMAAAELLLTILTMRAWTLQVDHRADIIMGVQGRYLLPFVVLPLFGIVKRSSPFSKGRTLVVSASLLCVVYICTVVSVICFFVPHPIV